MSANGTEDYTDELGYPTRAYLFAVCDAIREAGYEPDLGHSDVDDGKAWVTVRTHAGESLTLTWALNEWTNGPDGQPYHVGGPKDPAATAAWAAQWRDAEGIFDPGPTDFYDAGALVAEPAAVAGLVGQVIRDHDGDLQTFIAGWEWTQDGQARRAKQAGLRGGGFPFRQDDDTA